MFNNLSTPPKSPLELTEIFSYEELAAELDYSKLTPIENEEILPKLESLWWNFNTDPDHWEDIFKPLVKLRKFEDLKLKKSEEDGVLSQRMIANCSFNLTKSPVIFQYVLQKCVLANKMLCDISALQPHRYLQYLDVSCNHLTDLRALSYLPFLMYLDASNNCLEYLLDFKPPLYLTYVDYSNNYIELIKDLGGFWSLVYLDLSHNCIEYIRGFENLHFLRILNLSHNDITRLENLNNLRLEKLYLHHNDIYKFQDGETIGLRTLEYIKFVDLSHNSLNTLKLFLNVNSIEEIRINDNEIENLMEIQYLKHLRYLEKLDLRNNSVRSINNYQKVCLQAVKNLRILDNEPITPEARCNAKYFNKVNKIHSKLLLLQQINLIGLPIFNVELIVLVGPPGSNKGRLIGKFCSKNSRFAARGVGHTTRIKTVDEKYDVSYHYVSHKEFNELLRTGVFLTAAEYYGEFFGISVQEIEKCVLKKVVIVFHTDLTGAYVLKARGFRPKLVLALPSTAKQHLIWLKEKYSCYSQIGGIIKD